MASSETIMSVNQVDIFQVNGASSTITSETTVDFGKSIQKIMFHILTDDLFVDFTNTTSGTAGTACVRIPAGQIFWFESTQPIRHIKIKASAGVGRYTILAY